MKILIILAHPDKTSFNHAIADTVINEIKSYGHEYYFHDLYKEKFDPMLQTYEIPKGAPITDEIKRHCFEITHADGIIIIHPNWWGQPPAVLKGWIDRVIRPGVAYEFVEGDKGEGIPVGLLKAKIAVIFNTSNTETEREIKIFGDPLETIWKNCIFQLCGVNTFYRRTFSIVVTSSELQRKNWLKEVKEDIRQFFCDKKMINRIANCSS